MGLRTKIEVYGTDQLFMRMGESWVTLEVERHPTRLPCVYVDSCNMDGHVRLTYRQCKEVAEWLSSVPMENK